MFDAGLVVALVEMSWAWAEADGGSQGGLR